MVIMTTLTGQQVAAASLDGWAYLPTLDGGLQSRIRTGSFATGLKIVAAIGAAAEAMDHHPELDLRYDHINVRLNSDDQHGITERDVQLARVITSIATDAGLVLDSAGVARVELALDTPDAPLVGPFWRAVLGMDDLSDAGDATELGDPFRVLPAVWFQHSGSEEPRQRWHPDVWIEPAQVKPRIDAALAAGGTLVSDAEAPAFWMLADPEGNRMCLCTWQTR
jgi:4a-hydroxytetrahydrobiopterin dehydratase